MPLCKVDRRCFDINRNLIEAGGTALLAPDPKTKQLPSWAHEIEEEKPAAKAKGGEAEKPAAK